MGGALDRGEGANSIERREIYQGVKQEKRRKELVPSELGLKGWLGTQEKVRGKTRPEKEYHQDENRNMQNILSKYFNWGTSTELERNEKHKGHENSEAGS